MSNRRKPAGALLRGGRLVSPSSAGLTFDDIQARRPSTFSPLERKAWAMYAEQLAKVRQISETDLAALELLCYAYADLIECRRAVRKHGRTYTEITSGGSKIPRARPEVQMASDAARRHKGLLTELGMTPHSRGGVERHAPEAQRKVDAFEAVDALDGPEPTAPVAAAS